MRSNESLVLELFFDSPSREWHFEEIVRSSGIARSKALGWLQDFTRRGLIRRVKPRGRMPFYISNHDLPEYRNSKRIFALESMHRSGFLNHLMSLESAKAVILFGSFSRSDWHKGSDIDLFVYGSAEGLDIAGYESRLKRDIQLFACSTPAELARLGAGLIKNIISGSIIKGSIDFIKVGVNA